MHRFVAIAAVICAAACATQTTNPMPRRIANYRGGSSPSPSVDQCQLPVDQRKGGWFCYGSSP